MNNVVQHHGQHHSKQYVVYVQVVIYRSFMLDLFLWDFQSFCWGRKAVTKSSKPEEVVHYNDFTTEKECHGMTQSPNQHKELTFLFFCLFLFFIIIVITVYFI